MRSARPAARALGGRFELVARQRHAHAVRAKVLGRAQHQGAPATTDVQQPLARLQADLGEDVVQLLALGGGQVLVAVLEVGAGIDHALVQPEPVEVVGDVVVVLDGFAVRCCGCA